MVNRQIRWGGDLKLLPELAGTAASISVQGQTCLFTRYFL